MQIVLVGDHVPVVGDRPLAGGVERPVPHLLEGARVVVVEPVRQLQVIDVRRVLALVLDVVERRDAVVGGLGDAQAGVVEVALGDLALVGGDPAVVVEVELEVPSGVPSPVGVDLTTS